MTREEEIKQQSIIYTDNPCNYKEYGDQWETYNDIEYIEKAFEEGAKWADEHPNLYNDEKYHTVKVSDLDRLYKKLEAYEKYFDMACAWLEGRDSGMEYLYSEDGCTFFDNEKFINDFRKALEE